jgi:hypothetical protein
MSYEAHVAAVDAAVAELEQVGLALSQVRQQAEQAEQAVRNAVGSSPVEGPARDAMALTGSLASQASDGKIYEAMGTVANAIEQLHSYRAQWSGGRG